MENRVRSTLKSFAMLCGLLCTIVVTPPLRAQSVQPSLSSAVKKDVIFETKYEFYVRGYQDPILFDPSTYDPGKRNPLTPPDVVAMHVLRAQATGDISRYLEYLEPQYREVFEQRLKQESSSTKLAENWISTFNGTIVELTHRVDRGAGLDTTAIIQYRPYDLKSKKYRKPEGLAFRFSSRGWELVDLSGDLVFENWNFEGSTKVLNLR
ncbi:MAG: hypothetical protein ACE10A_03610 [Acidiferrobacterales bacterium]